MQINETKKFDVVLHFSKTLTFLAALTIVVLALHSPTLAWLLGGERTVQVSAAPAATVPAAAPAVDVPAVDPDTTAEGQDVLTLGYYDGAPADLWNGLLSHTEWYDDMDSDGYGLFSVPVGTVVDVPGGLYLATYDGWSICRDDWSNQECSATGPVWPIGIPEAPTDHGDGCAVAAGLILDALRTDAIYEDFSYAGMPDVVSACNDELATAFWAEHRATGVDMAAWLAQRAADPQNLAILTA